MSKFRMRLKMAEQEYTIDQATGYYIFNDGTVVDPDTGEVIENFVPENVEKSKEQLRKEWQQDMHNIMYEQVKTVKDDYRLPEYINQWDKVSPINILYIDHINDIVSMSPADARTFIINKLEELNKQYGDDKHYDYLSKEYINKVKLNLNKSKTIDKILEYLTNMYFKGVGMGGGTKQALTIDLNNRILLSAILPHLTRIALSKEQ